MWKLFFLFVCVALAALPVDPNCSGTWGETQPCTASCDGGVQLIQYTAGSQDGTNGCGFAADETRTAMCNTEPCSCPGHWQDDVSGCSASCDGGVVVQTWAADDSSCSTDTETRTAACNTDACRPTSTCASVTQLDCLALGLVLPGEGDLDQECTDCPVECCAAFGDDTETVTPDELNNHLKEDGKRVAKTKIYVADNDEEAVGFFNTSEEVPPIVVGGTKLAVSNFGQGVASAKIVVRSGPAIPAANFTVPAGLLNSVVVSIQRYDKDGNEVHDEPISWYQGSNTTTSLTVYIMMDEDHGGKLTDITTEGGTVLYLSIPVDPSYTNWFNVTAPHTSDFLATEVSCEFFKCKLGAKNESNTALTCPTGTCDDAAMEALCCLQPECGDGVLNWHNDEQCEPPNVGCCSATCKFKPKNTVCRRQLHPCERQSVCSGFSGACPKRSIVPDGTTCQPYEGHIAKENEKYFCLHGHCRKSRWCGNGKVERNEDCEPPGVGCCDSECHFKPSSVVCRAAAGPCDVTDFCSGKHGECGLDFKKPNGATCYNTTTSTVGMCLHGVCGDAMDYHSHSSSSSSSSSHH